MVGSADADAPVPPWKQCWIRGKGLMVTVDPGDLDIATRLARGYWVIRPHAPTPADGLPVAAWRASVARECEAAGVPYSFQIDLIVGVTVAFNPELPPSDDAVEARIARFRQSDDIGRDDET